MSEIVFFYIFSALAIGMVLLMIFQTNPVASALYLVLSFFGLAGLYVLLSATFVAVLQILIYAGAIMVLFVFVIMLLRLRKEDLIEDHISIVRIFVICLGLFFAWLLISFMIDVPFIPFKELPPQFGFAKEVGRLMFTKYLIPFELISITLLVAIIGVVILAKKETKQG